MYPHCVQLLVLLLLMPASNAQSERSFSTLRRIKSWLRTSIGQKRLNHCMVMNVHKERVDDIDLNTVMNTFILDVPQRSHVFQTAKPMNMSDP